MKTSKSKVLALVLCAALLVGGSVMATMAYLQDTAEVVNTFTVGQVKIALDEAKVNADGTPVDPAERTATGNAYHLIPGVTYTKDPTLTVKAGSEESYVRMIVTLNNAAAIKTVFGQNFLPQDHVDGWDSTLWECVAIIDGTQQDPATDTLKYEFRYKETVKPEANKDLVLDALFDTFTAPATLNNTALEKLAGFQISVEGHAIQKTGFATADAAWTAFDIQYAAEKAQANG